MHIFLTNKNLIYKICVTSFPLEQMVNYTLLLKSELRKSGLLMFSDLPKSEILKQNKYA